MSNTCTILHVYHWFTMMVYRQKPIPLPSFQPGGGWPLYGKMALLLTANGSWHHFGICLKLNSICFALFHLLWIPSEVSIFIVVIPARKYTDQNWARDHKSCLQHLATVLPLLHLLFRAASISVSTIGLGDTLQLHAFETCLDGLRTAWSFTARYAVPTKQLGVMSHSSAPGPRKPLPSFGLGGELWQFTVNERKSQPWPVSYLHSSRVLRNPFNMHLSQYCQFHPLMWVELILNYLTGKLKRMKQGSIFHNLLDMPTCSGSWTLPRYICRISRLCWPILITTFRSTAHSAHLGHLARIKLAFLMAFPMVFPQFSSQAAQ